MFRTALFPTDFSDVSRKALDCIQELHQGGLQRIVLLHVIDRRGLDALERYAAADSLPLEQRILQEAEEELRTLTRELEQSGLQVSTQVAVGFPVGEILKAESGDVDLIVIGSHGKSNVEEMFLGSVSEKVVRRCTKPVLIVKR